MEVATLENAQTSIIQNSAKQAPSNLISYSSNTTTIHRLVKETLTPGLITIRRVSLQEHENSKFSNPTHTPRQCEGNSKILYN